ncbi:BTB/POZ domain-containing protein At1g21780-like [Bidens hawaiensis]|uniref:BTB/POZ domain-containing protein At1g21780-like n=1 Tax=Bidens hawaiensis TaxID=980011 RepID=UPI00404B58DC
MMVETVSRLARWRVDNSTQYANRKSEPFKIGMWNWQLSVMYNGSDLCIRLFPEPFSLLSTEHHPFAKFILRVHTTAGQLSVSPVYERLLRRSEDFVWIVNSTFHGRYTIDVEFLDLRVRSSNGKEASSIWPNEGMLKSSASESILRCMLHESINTDVNINTCGRTLKAHKAILSASSPVFHSMFQHDLKEKISSTVDIEDMSLESCTAFVSYLYGTIEQEDFWKHRIALLGAANKYVVSSLKDLCEESLLEDINTGNVLELLQEAWFYHLDKLKKGCLTYLFNFGKIHEIKDQVNDFFKSAEKELVQEMLQEVLMVWKPV